MEIQAIIFDMDGVLIDSEHFYKEMNLILFNSLGAEITDSEYESFIGIAASKMWTYIRNKSGATQSVEELKQLEKTHKLQLLQSGKVKLIEGVLDLLESIKGAGLQMAVASSSPKQNIEFILSDLGISHFFEDLVSGEEVENGKPAPDIFLHTAKLLDAEPQKCWVIEDSANGAKAAHAANMNCLGFRSPHSGKQDFSTCQLIENQLSHSALIKIQQFKKDRVD